MIRIACCVVLVGMTGVVLASAQTATEVHAGDRVATAVRTAETIRLDGRLDDSAWQRARPAGALRQREPVENAEPSEETIVRVLYSDVALYIGIVSKDRSPR